MLQRSEQISSVNKRSYDAVVATGTTPRAHLRQQGTMLMSTSRRLRAGGALVGVQLVEARFADDVVVGFGLCIRVLPLVQRVPQLLVELVEVQPAAGTRGLMQRPVCVKKVRYRRA